MQVLPDAAEIGRVFRPALGIVSDLNAFAEAAVALEPVEPAWAGGPGNCGRCGRRSARCRTTRAAESRQVMRELEAMLAPDAIVTTDAGNFSVWALAS